MSVKILKDSVVMCKIAELLVVFFFSSKEKSWPFDLKELQVKYNYK